MSEKEHTFCDAIDFAKLGFQYSFRYHEASVRAMPEEFEYRGFTLKTH